MPDEKPIPEGRPLNRPGDYTVLSHQALPGHGRAFRHPTHATIRDNATGHVYEWNARDHRKMRYPKAVEPGTKQPKSKALFRFRFFSWEPHIVTWHICLIGFLANTLWVINGAWAVWPDIGGDAAKISFATGVVGAFLFIVTGYLGIVEVINQTHAEITFPDPGELDHADPQFTARAFTPAPRRYGQRQSPLEHLNNGLDLDETKTLILSKGYPLIFRSDNGEIFQGMGYSNDDGENPGEPAREIDILIGNQLFRATITKRTELGAKGAGEGADDDALKAPPVSEETVRKAKRTGYDWWSWNPDWSHPAVIAAYVFFISTIIFFIPAAIWYPVDENGTASIGTQVFFIDLLQVFPSIGFVFVGHVAMAEAAGSWWKPKLNSIGYWIAVCNTIGGWGFLLCGALAIPLTKDPGCCALLTRWGSAMSTFWGSCFFWIAGVLQCVEFSSQHPILLVRAGKAATGRDE